MGDIIDAWILKSFRWTARKLGATGEDVDILVAALAMQVIDRVAKTKKDKDAFLNTAISIAKKSVFMGVDINAN